MNVEKKRQRWLDRPDLTPVEKTCKKCNLYYHVPQAIEIPEPLRGLSSQQWMALRPFVLHQGTGTWPKGAEGYRKKNEASKLSWQSVSVRTTVVGMRDRITLQAYDFLMEHSLSAYRDFIAKHEAALKTLSEEGKTPNRMNLSLPTKYIAEIHIECALWPHLYPYRSWCDSDIVMRNQLKAKKRKRSGQQDDAEQDTKIEEEDSESVAEYEDAGCDSKSIKSYGKDPGVIRV